MTGQVPFKCHILRAVLHHVSPMVIRQVAVSDLTSLPEFNDIFCAILGWGGNLGYILGSFDLNREKSIRCPVDPITAGYVCA